MKYKNWKMTGIACMMVFTVLGCGNDKQSVALPEESGQVIMETDRDNQDDINIPEGIAYTYYVINGTGDELVEMHEGSVDTECNPDTILWLLSTGDVIPEGVTCSSINQKEENGKVTVYASFNSTLRDAMQALEDSQKEAMVIAALTNSFLDNYHGDYFRFSIDGANLETVNHIYNKPLGYFGADADFSVWEGYQYEIVEAEMVSENAMFSATYPQFDNVEDAGLKGQFNAAITDYLQMKMTEATDASILVHYDIAYQDGNFVSIILRGEENGTEQTSRFAVSFNFDFEAKTLRRLTTSTDISAVIDRIELGMNYEVTGESQMTSDQFTEYQNSGMNDDFMIQLLDYDFVLGNSGLVPSGFSYLDTDEKIVLIMSVPDELGSYVEIKMN